MNKITFSPRNQYGIRMYFSPQTSKYSVLFDEDSSKYYIRIHDDRGWSYPTWAEAVEGFNTLTDATAWLNRHDWENATKYHIEESEDAASSYEQDFIDSMNMLGFHRTDNSFFEDSLVYEFDSLDASGALLCIRVIYYLDGPAVIYRVNGKRLPKSSTPPDTPDLARMIRGIERMMKKYNHSIVSSCYMMDMSHRFEVMAAINTRDLSKDMVHVKSSNLWSYKLNIKDRHDKYGDLLVQFKNESGGPGDLYIYYEVPLMVYRRWQSAPSKGHYFWVYIRNNYKYSKLTGDKRGKLHNAVN